MAEADRHRLLLIDDEEGIRKVMAIALRDAGYEVLLAESGEQGIEVFTRERPIIVLTDIKMPGMDGLDVLRKVKEMDADAEVIMITGHGEMELAIRALQLEASDFITKPIHDEALTLALKRAEEKISLRRQLRDYTENLERKVAQATAEIKRINDFQASLIDNSLDGIVAADEQGRLVIFNSSAQRLTGYGYQEVVGKLRLQDLFPRQVVEHWCRFGEEGQHAGTVSRGDYLDATIRDRSGRDIPVRTTGVTLRDQERVIGCVVFCQDLREIHRLQAQLIQTERLAATGETVASLAHAIKNIVGGLKGGMFVVNKGFEGNNQQYLRQGWDMVQRNIGKISTLAMDLLTYCKDRRPEFTLTEAAQVVAEVAELLKPRADEFGVKLIIESTGDQQPVAMDANGIHQSLVNLVNNAIDACRPEVCGHRHGKVVLRTCRQPGWAVCFEVEDNGCGIAEEDKSKLFTTFFSTKGAEGTGLGLLNVQKIVDEHGGRVEVESRVGRGSLFRILLPERPGEGEQGSSENDQVLDTSAQ
ncbi:MAG: response regulator [Deltaproteobacteria bacterium]|nr:response regulator [Deltaproteobacteria bacterium]MBW2070578.1 response regulator [Deltaproteobacteria bacterium]